MIEVGDYVKVALLKKYKAMQETMTVIRVEPFVRGERYPFNILCEHSGGREWFHAEDLILVGR